MTTWRCYGDDPLPSPAEAFQERRPRFLLCPDLMVGLRHDGSVSEPSSCGDSGRYRRCDLVG